MSPCELLPSSYKEGFIEALSARVPPAYPLHSPHFPPSISLPGEGNGLETQEWAWNPVSPSPYLLYELPLQSHLDIRQENAVVAVVVSHRHVTKSRDYVSVNKMHVRLRND